MKEKGSLFLLLFSYCCFGREVELLNTINGSNGWLSHETTGFEGLGWSEPSIMGFQGSTFEYCPDDKTYSVP